MSETTFHFAGDLYIRPYVNGVLGGMIGPIDAESLEIKPDAKKNTIQSKAKATAGQARKTYYTPQPATISISMPACWRALMTPICDHPRAAPAPNARPILSFLISTNNYPSTLSVATLSRLS